MHLLKKKKIILIYLREAEKESGREREISKHFWQTSIPRFTPQMPKISETSPEVKARTTAISGPEPSLQLPRMCSKQESGARAGNQLQAQAPAHTHSMHMLAHSSQ